MTNGDLIKAALKLAKVLSEGDDPTAEQQSDGLATMNELFSDWEADGIDIGFYQQSNVSADSPIFDDAIRGAKYNLAVAYSADYETEPHPLVVAVAMNTYLRFVRQAAVSALKQADMDHLPNVNVTSDILNG